MPTRDADAFWHFSLSLYGQAGVAASFIELQDTYGVDVNILLYLLWRAGSRAVLSRDEIAILDAEIEPWRVEIVRPLRAVRRALKRDVTARLAADDGALRNAVKKGELEAERLQQNALARLGAALNGHRLDPAGARFAAWTAYGSYLGKDLPATALAALEEGIAAMPRA